MFEGLNTTVVICEFNNYNDMSKAITVMSGQGIHYEYVGKNRLEMLIQYTPGDLLRFIRMGQRDLRWKEAEESKGGGGYYESINPGV